jgi:hypothetical protein
MILKKNSSTSGKDTQLLTLFKAHFSGHLNLARIRLICLFISALCKVKSVNFVKLSAGFDTSVDASSSYRRIQRFMALADLSMIWVAKLIFSLLPEKDNLVLSMDRTNWKFGDKNINILMLGVSYKNVAFPILFKMLDKRGNSNTVERIALVQDFIDCFGKDCIDSLVADREFVGEQWLNFLNTNKIRYFIRIRNNFKIYCPRRQKEISAHHLFHNLRVGELRHYSKIIQMHGEYCYLSGTKSIKEGKVDFCIIVSYNKPDEALEYYAKRWQVETLFRALKTSGFNLEDTHVTHPERLEKLIMLVMIAFVWCYKIGDFIDAQIKAIRIKKHGRRAISVFRYGLDYISKCLLSGINKYNLNLFQFLSCT